jgi:hypothetical protein
MSTPTWMFRSSLTPWPAVQTGGAAFADLACNARHASTIGRT